MAERVRMRRVSIYFTNGSAQIFTNREDQQFTTAGELMLMTMSEDDAVAIRKETVTHWRVMLFWIEVKPGSQQLPAAEPLEQSSDLL